MQNLPQLISENNHYLAHRDYYLGPDNSEHYSFYIYRKGDFLDDEEITDNLAVELTRAVENFGWELVPNRMGYSLYCYQDTQSMFILQFSDYGLHLKIYLEDAGTGLPKTFDN